METRLPMLKRDNWGPARDKETVACGARILAKSESHEWEACAFGRGSPSSADDIREIELFRFGYSETMDMGRLERGGR